VALYPGLDVRGDTAKATFAAQLFASSHMLRKHVAAVAEPIAATVLHCFCDLTHVSVGVVADSRSCLQHMAQVSIGAIRHEWGAGAECSALGAECSALR
jgi:hypothetical protein